LIVKEYGFVKKETQGKNFKAFFRILKGKALSPPRKSGIIRMLDFEGNYYVCFATFTVSTIF